MAWSVFPINCPVLQESQVCTENWPWKGWISRVRWREIIHKFCSWSEYRELACDADVLAGAPTFQPTQNLKITTKHLQWQAHLRWHTRIYGFKRSESKSTGREVQILRRAWNHQTGYQEWQNLVQGSPQLGTTAVRIELVTVLQNNYVLWESELRWDGQDAQKAGGWRKLYKQHQKIYPQLSLITKKVSTSVISGK